MTGLQCTAMTGLILLNACDSPGNRVQRTPPPSLQIVQEVRCGTSRATQPGPADGGEAHCFSSAPLLDENEVISAAKDENANGRPLVLTIDETARRRLRQFTAQNIGTHVGIFVNGRLVSVPMIAAPSSRVWITGYTEDEQRQLLQSFGTIGPAR
jgi:preprotein translocase subunit SecD